MKKPRSISGAPGLGALLLASALLALSLGACVQKTVVQRSDSSSSKAENAPMPPLDTRGLSEYEKHVVFASRYIEEGDYESAIEELDQARELKGEAPHLHELYGFSYEGKRREERAFEHFVKAGQGFYTAGQYRHAWRVVGRLKTFGPEGREEAAELEEKLREKQRELNRHRFEKEK